MSGRETEEAEREREAGQAALEDVGHVGRSIGRGLGVSASRSHFIRSGTSRHIQVGRR